jgi:hypothetical protein
LLRVSGPKQDFNLAALGPVELLQGHCGDFALTGGAKGGSRPDPSQPVWQKVAL